MHDGVVIRLMLAGVLASSVTSAPLAPAFSRVESSPASRGGVTDQSACTVGRMDDLPTRPAARCDAADDQTDDFDLALHASGLDAVVDQTLDYGHAVGRTPASCLNAATGHSLLAQCTCLRL